MINSIKINNETYDCIMCWNKKNKPSIGTFWSGEYFFLEKLSLLENNLIKQHKFTKSKIKKCQLCNTKFSDKMFLFKGIAWDESLSHYVNIHHIKPPSNFIRFVLNNDPTILQRCTRSTVKIKGKFYKQSHFTYLKVKSNQLLILDALLEHGGITPKYKEKHESGFRYSEHAGMLDFDNYGLERIIISSNSSRQKHDDPEIFMPELGESAFEYEYIFHTHPSTPRPGGRAIDGVLYEFPSSNDIIHFTDHYNAGNVQGSIVITPEGLYNIRTFTISDQKVILPKNFKSEMMKITIKIQNEAIDKYGIDFTTEEFYDKIGRDTEYINRLNEFLIKYGIFIDYFPRQKTKKGGWVIGTIYLPICILEKV